MNKQILIDRDLAAAIAKALPLAFLQENQELSARYRRMNEALAQALLDNPVAHPGGNSSDDTATK